MQIVSDCLFGNSYSKVSHAFSEVDLQSMRIQRRNLFNLVKESTEKYWLAILFKNKEEVVFSISWFFLKAFVIKESDLISENKYIFKCWRICPEKYVAFDQILLRNSFFSEKKSTHEISRATSKHKGKKSNKDNFLKDLIDRWCTKHSRQPKHLICKHTTIVMWN
jgi:hypothetical protein